MLQSCGGPKQLGWGRTAEAAPDQHKHGQSASPLVLQPWFHGGGGLFTLQLCLGEETGSFGNAD